MGPVRAGLQPGLQIAARCWTRTEWSVRRAAEEETEPENTYWTLETHHGGSQVNFMFTITVILEKKKTGKRLVS